MHLKMKKSSAKNAYGRTAMKIKSLKTMIGGLCLLLYSLSIEGATVIIPENIHNICYYTDFFYNLPDHDFIYHLNDRLLFSDPPNEKLFDSGIRRKLLNVTFIHKKLQEYITEKSQDSKLHLSVDVSNEEGIKQVEKLMGFLGLELRRDQRGQYEIMINASIGIIDYYRFSRLNIEKLEQQINKTKRFYMKLEATLLPIPWEFPFLEAITGLKVDSHNFFETLLKDERFSLLISVMYRLSRAEVDYISLLKPNHLAWKQIYKNKKLLIGLFTLSHALRIQNNRLVLPGGDQAKLFWSQLSGCDVSSAPFEFIKAIATKDDGKLNYLYVFAFFLPEEKLKVLFFNFDSLKMLEIYNRISLQEKARLQGHRFPRLENYNFFSLLYLLKIQNGSVFFPGGIESWLEAFRVPETDAIQMTSKDSKLLCLLRHLLEGSGQRNKENGMLEKFIILYSKFIDRSEIMTAANIAKLYQNHEKYNILIDYIEKIPITKPELVSEMIDWVTKLDQLNKNDKIVFTSLFQSMFEIFSHQASFDPKAQDFNRITGELIRIPFSKSDFYQGFFLFLKNEMKLFLSKNTIDQAFIADILKGIPNQYIKMNNRKYQFFVQDSFQNIVNDIIHSQEVCFLSTLVDINSRLEKSLQTKGKNVNQIKTDLLEINGLIPHPDISNDAPRFIINRVKKYQKPDFEAAIQNLIVKIEKNAPEEEKKLIVSKIQSEYLIHHLQEYLLTICYALNAKNERLRIFLNPNLTRFHDFDDSNGNTPWNHCSTPKTKKKFEGFYFQGGLSRLNIELSQSWRDHLFSRNIIYDQEQIQAVITNILELYPAPAISESQSYIALLTEFGLELIQKSKSSQVILQDVANALGYITSGYHYRKIMDFLTGKSNEYYLFFSEIYKLGEYFQVKNKLLNEFSASDKLGMISKTYLNKIVQKELEYFGGVYYHLFGSLRSRWIQLFPQEISNLFESDRVGGEIINEFKIKTAYHAYKKLLPPKLMGQFLVQYLYNICRRYFSQNYIKDYYSTYFIFDIMNNSHLTKIVQKLQENGEVRLK